MTAIVIDLVTYAAATHDYPTAPRRDRVRLAVRAAKTSDYEAEVRAYAVKLSGMGGYVGGKAEEPVRCYHCGRRFKLLGPWWSHERECSKAVRHG